MRILPMGTGPFAVPTFLSLLEAGHDVPALITRPERARRGRSQPPPSPMRQAADDQGLPVYAPESINAHEAHALLEELKAELFVVCDYGQILSRQTLKLARLGGVNLHASLLPKYRGAAPINWALYHGERETGVSVIHMTPRLDGGPVLATRRVEIEPYETAPALEARLADRGVAAVHEAIEQLAGWDGERVLGEVQDQSQATKAPRLTKDDGLARWSRSARGVIDQFRAMQPWPGLYTYWLGGKEPLRLIVHRLRELNDVELAAEAGGREPTPGEVVLCDGQRLWIAAGEGAVALEQVQPAGKRAMPIADFLRGHRIEVGQRMGAPE